MSLKEKSSVVLFASMPLILCCIYCAIQSHLITDIYLPWGHWNDEAIYYKQVEAMIKYGIPQGYFGYSETTAKCLTFGPWSVFLLIPYAIIGKVIGWNYFTPIICNLFFVETAHLCLTQMVYHEKWTRINYSLFILGSPLLIRYTLSGLPEALCFSEIILFYVCFEKMREMGKRYLCFILLILFYLTLCRPYFMVLILLPIAKICSFSYTKKRKILIIIILIGYALFTESLYFINAYYLCAPYFTSIINTSFLNAFQKSVISGLLMLFHTVTGGIGNVVTEVINGNMNCTYVLTVFLLLCIMAIRSKEIKSRLFFYITIWEFAAMFIAITLFYSSTAARHLFWICILGGLILSRQKKQNNNSRLVLLSVLVLLSIIYPKSNYDFEIPYRSQDVVRQYAEIKEKLENEIDVEQGGWNNTVTWVVDADYSICYLFPAGVGINICREDIIEGIVENPFKSKYIFTDLGGQVDQYLHKQGKEVILLEDNWLIYKNY